MAATLTTKALSNRLGTVTIPLAELSSRVIQRYEAEYTAGEWNPDNSYNWIPGSFVDFTPLRSDSMISYIWRAPTAFFSSTHGISHWKFYVAGSIYSMHSTSSAHQEDGSTYIWEVPSWGAGVSGRVGYQMRAYSNNSHEIRVYSTNYWNGSASRQTANGQLIVEEIAGVGLPTAVGEPSGKQYTAR